MRERNRTLLWRLTMRLCALRELLLRPDCATKPPDIWRLECRRHKARLCGTASRGWKGPWAPPPFGA